MRRKILRISAELFVEILKGFQDGNPRYFSVVKHPLPPDAKFISAHWSQEVPNCMSIVIESEEFPELAFREVPEEVITPVLRTEVV